ncbi:MAG: hypothetical protein AB7V46_01455 [Thermomicrobiales bacterium]
MHKPVRYYITESNDQPVVRSVQIATRYETESQPVPMLSSQSSTGDTGRLSKNSIIKKIRANRNLAPRS